MMNGLIIMRERSRDLVYAADTRREIGSLVNIISEPLTADDVKADTSILKEVDVIFSGWGGLHLTEAFLDAAPNLEIVFHAAGSIKPIVSDAFWERDITITTANFANSIPVAEFTLSQILFALKDGWRLVHEIQKNKAYPPKEFQQVAGGFGSTVGLISLSTIGREVNKYLQSFNLNVVAYDPFVTEEEAVALNVELCSLSEVFKKSDVVSLHTPLLPETTGMIKGEHFEHMKDYASFINTARGAIVNEAEMIAVLKRRQDMTAILDVTYPEPPVPGSPLYEMPNVVLLPHIAGSLGPECGRMGAFMLSELKRYLNGEQLKWQITKKQFDSMA